MHLYVYSSTTHNSRDLEAATCPLRDEWVEKMRYASTMK